MPHGAPAEDQTARRLTSRISFDAQPAPTTPAVGASPPGAAAGGIPSRAKAAWQKPVTKDRDEVLSWLGVGKKGARHARERARSHRTFASIGDEWLDGARAGRISRRKGRSKPHSPTTIADYMRAYRNFLRPVFGPMPAGEIGERLLAALEPEDAVPASTSATGRSSTMSAALW